MSAKVQHLPVYLRDNQYQCQKCGLINTREQVKQGWSKECVVTEIQDIAAIVEEAGRKLDAIQKKVDEDLILMIEDLQARLGNIEGAKG